MYFRQKQSGGRVYLQIVESRRTGDKVRQQVIATLGRLDELTASGQLERLLRSGARFAARARALVLEAVRDAPSLGGVGAPHRAWAGVRAVVDRDRLPRRA